MKLKKCAQAWAPSVFSCRAGEQPSTAFVDPRGSNANPRGPACDALQLKYQRARDED
jgi:hypothetical protein